MTALSDLAAGLAQGAHQAVEAGSHFSSSLFSRMDPTTLSAAPSTLLLGALPIAWHLSKSSQNVVRPGILLQFKIALGSLLVGTEAGFLASRLLNTTALTDEPVLAALLSALTACSLCWILTLDHQRSLSSSALITVWLIIAATCDMLRAIVFYHDQSMDLLSTAAVVLPATSSAVFKASLIVLSELPKHDLIMDVQLRNITCKENTAGILSRTLWFPFYERFLSKFDNEMSMADLADLETDFASNELLKTFNAQWNTRNKKSSQALARVCGTILKRKIISTAPLRLICSLFTVSQPIIIKYTVQYALEIYGVNSGSYTALFLSGAAACVYGGSALSRGVYDHEMSRLATLLRGTLIAAVYQKTLLLAKSETPQHLAMTVISKRVDSTVREVPLIHNIWANPLELIVCVYILFTALGNAAFLVILPAIASHCVGWYARDHLPTDRVVWHEKIKDRVGEVSDMLSEIKAAKSIGLDMTFLSRIRKRFATEIAHYKKFRWWAVVLVASMHFFELITYPLVIGGALFLAVWAGRLSAVEAFTALAAITVMAEPLRNCSVVSSELKSALTRLSQIEDYLLLEEIQRLPSQHILVKKPDSTSTKTADLTIASPEQIQTNNDQGSKSVFTLIYAAISIPKVPYPVLERINATTMEGDITMIVGRSGSGKTSLLRSLIGEAKVTAGFRHKTQGMKTAYCGQSAWLWNKSIRKNIIAYSTMNADWYNLVLDVCLLRPDLQQFRKGDKTIIEADGIKLSESQKQRVALARAIYSRPTMLVLDDIFSKLDEITVSTIGSRLFRPIGILRRSGTTVVLVTHSQQLLRFATRTWSFDVNGRLLDQSGPGDAAFRRKFQAILASIASDEDELRANIGDEGALPETILQSADTEAIASYNQRVDAKRRNNWHTVLFYLQTFEYPKFALLLGLTILTALGTKFPVVYFYLWLDTQSGTGAWLSSYALLAVAGAFFTGCSVHVWFMQLVPRSIKRIHKHMLEIIMDATFCNLSTIDMRSVLTMFTQDLFCMADVLPHCFFDCLYDFWNVCVQSAIIIYLTGYTGVLVAPFIIAVLAVIQFCYMGRSRQLTYLELDSQTNFQTHLTDTENGLEHIRAFGWQAHSLRSALRLLDVSQKPFYYNHGARNWLRIAQDTVTMFVGVLLITYTLSHLQTMPVSALGVSLTTLISLSASLPSLSFSWTTLQVSLGALDRIKKFAETVPREHGLPIKTDHEVGKEWPENGKVVIRNVSAKYKDSDKSPVILKGISLMLPPGRHVGVVGDAGSGKTSFTRAILNFLEHSGDIIIDGINIAKVPHSVLRSRITTVSQDNIKFDESVRYNLCPWTMSVSETEGNVHDNSIILMLKTLKLWHLVLMNGGLDSPYKNLGLSPGQKKLMCIARACLHKLSTRSRLVIIDGALDGLDDEDQELALLAMDAAFFDCTIIEVAESSEDIPEAHLILYMENGRVVRRELPNEGVPDSPPPSPPPTMPTAPVPMNPRFQRMLDKSLAAEREVKQQLQDQGLWPPELGE